MPLLNNKEIVILENISRNSSISQRELAKKTGISLGLINVILKKFNKNGFLKITNLNKRKMEYLLTPMGSLETARIVYREAVKTIRLYKKMSTNLENLLKRLRALGYDYFSICGEGEIREFVENVFRQCVEESLVTLGGEHRDQPRAVVLNATAEPLDSGFNGDIVNVLEKIGD